MEILELCDLVDEVRKKCRESEWVEFKVNNENPEMVGEYLSALSNSACLHDREHAFLIYGIDDKTMR